MQSPAAGAAQVIKMALIDDPATGTFTETVGPLPW
jgi:hypothetical protein